MTISKEARLALVHEEAISEFNKVQVAMRDERCSACRIAASTASPARSGKGRSASSSRTSRGTSSTTSTWR
jgi:hypothetical protein